jgi:hypothetical protein
MVTMSESYYFAKSSGKSFNLQVQRLHQQSHADPVYDIRRKQASRRKVKKAVHVNNPGMPIPLPTTPPSDGSEYLLFDGTAPPLSNDHDEMIYTAYIYDEPSLHCVQLTSHGLLFNPVTTPYLQSPAPRRARIESSSPPREGSTAQESLPNLNDDAMDLYFGQPVCWLLVPSKTNYKLIDQATGTLIGKWMRHSSSNAWSFVIKGAGIATLDGDRVRLANAFESETFIDEFSHNLRKSHIYKKASDSPSFLQQVLTRRANSDIDLTKRAKKSNVYRARFIDGIMFSSLALRMAETEKPSRSTSPESDDAGIEFLKRRNSMSDKGRRMSGLFTSLKQALS